MKLIEIQKANLMLAELHRMILKVELTTVQQNGDDFETYLKELFALQKEQRKVMSKYYEAANDDSTSKETNTE